MHVPSSFCNFPEQDGAIMYVTCWALTFILEVGSISFRLSDLKSEKEFSWVSVQPQLQVSASAPQLAEAHAVAKAVKDKTFSMEEVEKHDTRASAWFVHAGTVRACTHTTFML